MLRGKRPVLIILSLVLGLGVCLGVTALFIKTSSPDYFPSALVSWGVLCVLILSTQVWGRKP